MKQFSYDSSPGPIGPIGDDEEFIRQSKEFFEAEKKKGERPIIINIFGGPGAGKSTTAALTFGLLKLHGVNVELITEFAKDLTWEERHKTFDNQYYIWSKQYHRMWRVKDKVDVIVTDAPLLHSLIYGPENTIESFHQLVLRAHHDFNNRNYYLTREKEYEEAGRSQTLEQAVEIDEVVLRMLMNNKIEFLLAAGDHTGPNYIAANILEDELNIKFKYRTESIQNDVWGE